MPTDSFDTLVTLTFVTAGAQAHPRRDDLTRASVSDEGVAAYLIITARHIQSVYRALYAEEGVSFPWDDMLSRYMGGWLVDFFLEHRAFPTRLSIRLKIRKTAQQLEKEHGSTE